MKNLINRLVFATAVVLMMSLTDGLFAQGTVDLNFGTNGTVLTKTQASRDDISQSIALTPEGKIVIAGNSFNAFGYSNVAIVRYKIKGKIDKTFNGTGKRIINNAFCNVVAVQPDGKIVIGGSVAVGSSSLFGLWRLNSDGTNDNTFGTNGYQTVAFSGYVICFTMKLLPDGKILIGGNDGNFYAGNSSLILARLNANGQLDNTFSGDGKFSLNLTHKSLTCNEILLQPDGKIIAAGQLDTIIDPYFHLEFFATRLNTDGTTDPSFGNNGIIRGKSSSSDISYCAGLLPDGRIVMGGYSKLTTGNKASVLCLTANGTIDNTFGTNGWMYPSFYNATAIMRAAMVQTNGKVIFAGDVYNNDITSSIGLVRLNGNGTLDPSFANAGLDTFFNANQLALSCNDGILQSDGKILITGFKVQGNGFDAFFTARFLNSQQFQKESFAATDVSISNLNIFPVPVSTNSVMVGFSMSNPGNGIINIYDTEGKRMITPLQFSFESGIVRQQVLLPGDIANGIYICSVTINGNVKTLKFIVEK